MHRIHHLAWITLLFGPLLALLGGCTSDDRVVAVAREAADRQAQQNAHMAETVQAKQPYEPVAGDEALLEGLVAMTDVIADQAHDQHGIDCLLYGYGPPQRPGPWPLSARPSKHIGPATSWA